MTRRKIVAGNWKMNKTVGEALTLVRDLRGMVSMIRDRVEVVVAPLQQRFLAHFGLISPGIAVRTASGAAGQKAAAEVAAGHSKDKR